MVGIGYSPRIRPEQFLPPFVRLLQAGGTFYRDGSGALTLCYVACGRLLGYVEPHINSWDCLGALAVIEAAGGIAKEFNTIAIDDGIAMGHDGMLYSLPSREIIADSVEYMVNAHCADAMVCISNCDKITPGMLMAAMRLNIPVVFVSGGPMEAGKVKLANPQTQKIEFKKLDLIDAMVMAADDKVSDADVAAKLKSMPVTDEESTAARSQLTRTDIATQIPTDAEVAAAGGDYREAQTKKAADVKARDLKLRADRHTDVAADHSITVGSVGTTIVHCARLDEQCAIVIETKVQQLIVRTPTRVLDQNGILDSQLQKDLAQTHPALSGDSKLGLEEALAKVRLLEKEKAELATVLINTTNR